MLDVFPAIHQGMEVHKPFCSKRHAHEITCILRTKLVPNILSNIGFYDHNKPLICGYRMRQIKCTWIAIWLVWWLIL